MHAYDPNQQTYHLLWMRHLYHTYSRCTSQVCSLLPLNCIHIHVAIPIDLQLQEQSLCMTSSSECVSFEVCRAVVLSREFFSFSHWGAPWTRCFNLTTLKQNKTVLRTISQHPKTNLEFVKKSNSSHQATKIEPYPVISFELNLTPPLNLPWPTTTPLNFFQNNTSSFIPPKNADTENQKQPPPHKRVTTPKPEHPTHPQPRCHLPCCHPSSRWQRHQKAPTAPLCPGPRRMDPRSLGFFRRGVFAPWRTGEYREIWGDP